MATDYAELFLASPTLELLDKCRKGDLALIATRLDVPFPKQIAKCDLKLLLAEALTERGILLPAVVPKVTKVDPSASTVVPGKEAGVEPLAATASDGDEGETGKTPFTLPRFDPSSLTGSGSRVEARLKVRLARMQVEAQERARQLQFDLEVKKLQIEADTAVRIRQLELAGQSYARPHVAQQMAAPQHETPDAPRVSSATPTFDVSKHITLVPVFREAEVDVYFQVFERLAIALHWPEEIWAVLIQCKMQGKAQEVISALPLTDSLDYGKIKTAILRAYELVPEAYRQKFRKLRKSPQQTYVEFSRLKMNLFEKWCHSCNANSFDLLKELVLLEEFKQCLPDRVVTYLNEQKVETLTDAAVLSDEFALIHKHTFEPVTKVRLPKISKLGDIGLTSNVPAERQCFYCHQVGHIIADCPSLKKKQATASGDANKRAHAKGVGFTQNTVVHDGKDKVDPCFKPFILEGCISLSENSECKPITMLRDTGGSQSVILSSVLPFSADSACGYSAILRGIELGYTPKPIHTIYIKSKLVTGYFPIAVSDELPIEGVALLLGNDIAGGKVLPSLEVVDVPITPEMYNESAPFPVCAVTRSQARANTDICIEDSFLMPLFAETGKTETEFPVAPKHPCKLKVAAESPSGMEEVTTAVPAKRLSELQRLDPTLYKCFEGLERKDNMPRSNSAQANKRAQLYLENEVLMRKWYAPGSKDNEWGHVTQVVLPQSFRQQVLSLAHESCWSGHLGITKTYHHILQHFFWPGLKQDVGKFCRSCHVCQLAGKPNQGIPRAPLCPIPVVTQPFGKIIIDCVGPLPRTRNGNQYLLTIMCTATRYPEALPLKRITAPIVVKALMTYFATFGLPQVIQTDQGTNFMSKTFQQVMKTLEAQHVTSSAYHPESQGALERWHQTVKSMLRKYCLETEKEWDEGLPFVLFAARNAKQESLGFSPYELVFAHTPRSPLKAVKETILNANVPACNVLSYVSKFRERLHTANQLAKETLEHTQTVMKRHHDQTAIHRQFTVGDQVLVLLPQTGSSLNARFTGPYTIDNKLSDTDYLIHTPDRRRKKRVCHVNMLKRYFSRGSANADIPQSVTAHTSAVVIVHHVDPDDPEDREHETYPTVRQTGRLTNSEELKSYSKRLTHLNPEQQADIKQLVKDFPCLFNDVPTRTNVLTHDIDVGDARPIKQHPYRVNLVKRAVMKSETDYLLRHGFAISSHSAWSSPCLVEAKSDGTPRFITDFRKVNHITVPDSYPLPRMEDCVDNVGSARFVSRLDLLKGYWQVPLTERASEIAAFVTPDCLLQYTVMAFGLCNAPATFQRLMNIVLHDVEECSVYLDDVVVYTQNWPEHVNVLCKVFERLAQASLTLNLAKCEFGQATVRYLGREVGQGQVRPVIEKIHAIVNFPVPTTRRMLRRFLGMAGYYRAFCRNFATVAQPLTSLLSPKERFEWTPDCQSAFECLKALLCHSPVLQSPDHSKPFRLDIDASDVGAGAVLLQDDLEGIEHPVSYFSRKFNKYQTRYSTVEKETLALILALQHFDVYVGSSHLPILVYTDHNPLVFLARMYNHNQRLMRWALTVQDYHLEIRHKKGSENLLADALSRCE
uniref:Gypsy retrotransposon integrase-like protein 1 n=2 Tax=Mastacembelus armatus TaxID=205130 RepID=A0A7N8YKI4_9TELE